MSGQMSQHFSTRPSKKRKRPKRDTGQQEKQADARQAKSRPPSDNVDESIGLMNGTLLADLFAQRIKRHMKDLTSVEVSDLQVPGKDISITFCSSKSGHFSADQEVLLEIAIRRSRKASSCFAV